MGYWGVAMADFNQVNGGPTVAGVAEATQALAKADSARDKDPREAAYIQALHGFFDGYKEDDFYVYAKRYTNAMAGVAGAYPKDLEAQTLLDGKFAEALSEYQASLKIDPNRFNALLGAGEAAERLGEHDVAAGYYRTLLANCVGANGDALAALKHPRMVVNKMAIRPFSGNRETTGSLK